MIVFLILLLLAFPACSAIIHVPADYPTVQQGLNAAAEHDTVLVADGLYYENLTFPLINLTLASQFLLDGDSTHIASTILNGSQPSNPDSASVLFMEGQQDSSTIIAGFTFTGGAGILSDEWWPGASYLYGGGCTIRHAAPVLKFNMLHSNTADFGAGLYLGTGADILLQNNEIFENSATRTGGGIRGDSCSPKMISNHFHHNSSGYQAGGLFFHCCDSLTLTASCIDHNQAPVIAGGHFDHGYFLLTGNVIADQVMTTYPNPGAGLSFGSGPYYFTNVTLSNNQFLRNSGGFGGALCMQSGVAGVIAGNLFQDNSAVLAAALNLWDGTYSISNNQFINNYDSTGAAIYVGTGANVTMQGNTITGNTTGAAYPGFPSAIGTYLSIPIDIQYNNIFGNSPPAVAPMENSPFPTLNAINNWWGDPSGPYHPTLNPNGLGDAVGDNVLFDPWLDSPVGVEPSCPSPHPAEFRLQPAFPNPFNPTTTLRFTFPLAGQLNLAVYDIRGRQVTTLVDGWRKAGWHEVTFDGSDLASGVYIYRLRAGQESAAGKMVLIK